MFAVSIPLIPPPSSSLLPPFHDRPLHDTARNENASNSLLQQQQHRRNRSGHQNAAQSRSQLAMLSFDERTIAQRKMAIAMYGYSWLKPAGCNKTMLGRREEEIEREEVERQLREVEIQERNALEAEEAERRTRLEEQGRRERAGEDVGLDEGERDLDEDVPDMDDADGFDDHDELDEDDEDEGVDLDADVPEADANWQYDTTRDLDTESEGDNHDQLTRQQQNQTSALRQGRGRVTQEFQEVEDQEAAEQEALVNAMLDEDELGELEFQQRDLDDDLPDMDADMSMAMDNDERDLDDEVPEADTEDGDGWEHTDTELEESEMDISILPPAQRSAVRSTNLASGRDNMPPPSFSSSTDRHQLHGRRRAMPRYSTASEQSEPDSSMRRTSGNMLPPPPAFNIGRSQQQGESRPGAGHNRAPQPPQPRRSPRTRMQTPSSATSSISVSALISTGNTTDVSGGMPRADLTSSVATNSNANSRSRTWLNPSGTRRNLFGSLRGAGQAIRGVTNTSRNVSNIQNQAPGGMITNSSGGLFTPSPRMASGLGPQTRNAGVTGRPFEAEDTPEPEMEPESIPEHEEAMGHTEQSDTPANRTRGNRLPGLGLGLRSDRRRRQRDVDRDHNAWDDT